MPVMADSQWSNKNDPRSPATCAVDVITPLNQQFIAADDKFVDQAARPTLGANARYSVTSGGATTR
jgi:hypothetical protein